MVAFHDRLLALPLGSGFFLPEFRPGVAFGAGGTDPSGLGWRSFGDTIMITDPTGKERVLP